MNTAVEVLEPITHGLPSPDNEKILRNVKIMEKISAIVPLSIIIIIFALPTFSSLFQGNLLLVLIGGFIMFIIAGLAIKIVDKIILRPIRYVRYKSAAQILQTQMQSLPEPISLWRSWFLIAPGVLAITRAGHVVIVDRSTNYNHLWLAKEQIVSVSVEREATHISKTSHSGSFTFGNVSSGGFLSAFTTGGRSSTTTRTVETAFLEIRYQFERNGAVYTSVVPFGEDRRGADELRAAIMHLQPAA
ncbi:putative membrane protein YgcG [Azospirillum fermentarium]|uniref:hypothetical protein n=1 Tax=Azospirillum fermentarium TaxID=1233114 RepID=UPI002226A424|nr:hypothetical protein [Azospirillum fermentarium]MCW2244630.1 putative membrane protein YgcG [Azospirillum fermentarium]